MKPLAYVLVTLLGCITGTESGAAVDGELSFSARVIMTWATKSFRGETEYRLVDIDGREAVHASCSGSASGKYLHEKIDLSKTPIMEWTWRIDEPLPPGVDETTRAGDDYSVRVYVIKDGGWRPWRTRALNYVWSRSNAGPVDWPNAYTPQAHMIAVRSGQPGKAGLWATERRNVREDFKRYHNMDLAGIDAVAIMTDCDDMGTVAEGWYRNIRFVPE
jgi:hypothetical protein